MVIYYIDSIAYFSWIRHACLKCYMIRIHITITIFQTLLRSNVWNSNRQGKPTDPMPSAYYRGREEKLKYCERRKGGNGTCDSSGCFLSLSCSLLEAFIVTWGACPLHLALSALRRRGEIEVRDQIFSVFYSNLKPT